MRIGDIRIIFTLDKENKVVWVYNAPLQRENLLEFGGHSVTVEDFSALNQVVPHSLTCQDLRRHPQPG